MAWRDTSDFALSCVIDPGPPDESLTIRRKRVSSPRAAKSGAASRTRGAAATLLLDILADVLDLRRPPAAVHLERLRAAPLGDLVESGLDDGELRAIRGILEVELDERGGLLRIVDVGIHCARVPAIREEALRLDGDDGHVQ